MVKETDAKKEICEIMSQKSFAIKKPTDPDMSELIQFADKYSVHISKRNSVHSKELIEAIVKSKLAIPKFEHWFDLQARIIIGF